MTVNDEDDTLGTAINKGKNSYTYTGDFVEDLIQGQGILERPADGYTYEGSFKGGLRHGFGEER